MAQDRPSSHTVVVQVNSGNSSLGTAGLAFACLGWLTCGLLAPLGIIFSFLGLFSNKSKSHAIAGLVISAPAILVYLLGGFTAVLGVVGIGAAAVDQAQKAAVRMQEEQARKQIEESTTPPPPPANETPADESMAGGSIPVEDATKPSESETKTLEDATKPVIPATEPAKDETTAADLPPSPPVQPPVKQPVIRKWASADRKFTVEAEYVSHDSTQVTLKRVDNGKEINVPIEKLCVDDKQYLLTLEF